MKLPMALITVAVSLTIVTVALALAIVTDAQAADLASGSFQAETFICHAVNVGSRAVDLTVDIVNSGTGLVENSNSCPDVGPNLECQGRFDVPNANAEIAFCRITTSGAAGQIRATFIGVLGTDVQVTEAR